MSNVREADGPRARARRRARSGPPSQLGVWPAWYPRAVDPAMTPVPDLRPTILAAWRTNSLVTAHLVEQLPTVLWDASIPGIAPPRTVRTIAAHLHNARSRWIRTLGQPHGIAVPPLVDLQRVTRRSLLVALKRSGRGIEALLELGIAAGGQIPPTKAYTWRNLPLDVGHVLAYFVAHEGHHRGQIVMAARQLGHRLPPEVTNGLWQWTACVREWKREP
jgi:uncharacterized damage-inducible protein DinB